MMAAHLTLAMMVLLSQLLLLPPILSEYQVLWTLWLQVPLVAATFLASPAPKDLMKQMPRTWASRGGGGCAGQRRWRGRRQRAPCPNAFVLTARRDRGEETPAPPAQ